MLLALAVADPGDVGQMMLGVAWLLCLALTATVVAVHRWTIGQIDGRRAGMAPLSTTAVVIALFVAHFIESVIFGLGYVVAAEALNLGSLTGATTGALRDYLYYSIVTYTSLGLGDVFPEGELRLVTGFEVLTGLLMIGWSAAVLFEHIGSKSNRDSV